MKLAKTILRGVALTTLAATAIAGSANAESRTNTISLDEINNFIAKLNTKLESPNSNVGLYFLEDHLAPDMQITNRVRNYTTQQYRQVYYSYNGYAYRYPTAVYEPRTSVHYTYNNLGKADWVNDFLRKKAAWAGYKPVFSIKSSDRDAARKTAFIDVDLREYTLTYNPAATQFYGQQASAAADCQMTLEKSFGEMKISRLSCEYSRHFAM